MNLKNLSFPVYGDQSFRGDCPVESVEQISFFNKIRKAYPDTWGRIALHPRNEQLLIGGQFKGIIKHKAEGMTPGASDIVVPGSPPFICELKRRDHTQSKWQDDQIAYLETAQALGAFTCVALGATAAWQAFEDYLERYYS